MSTLLLPYRLGKPDYECHYPVIVSPDPKNKAADLVLGSVFRWHRNWLADSSAGEHSVGRPPKGQPGAGAAAAATYLVEQYAAGSITATLLTEATTRVPPPFEDVPLLHERLKDTDRNRDNAHRAIADLKVHYWRHRGGYPGSDNPWYLECILPGCEAGWGGPKYRSHERGRNGEPPSPYRHPGCLPADQVRKLIAAYQQ